MTVTISDIEVGLGRPLTNPEQLQAYQWVDDATLLITTKFGAAFADLSASLVDYVIRASIVARFKGSDGDGLSSVSVAVDDGTVTKRWDSNKPQDDWLISGWFDLLAPTRDAAAFSTRPGFDADDVQWPVSTPLTTTDPDWRVWY